MKILVTGATGLLGRAVYRMLKDEKNFNVVGTGFSRAALPIFKVNLMDRDQLDALLDTQRPGCIVHCAAERRPDVSEADPGGSEKLNVDVTEHIAEYAEKSGSFMIYISTDYVFDGKNPPYFPDSRVNPLNFYGRTKLAGEEAVQDKSGNFLILRVPILYGGEVTPTESSISSVAASLARNKGGGFDDTAVRYPTHTEDVARVISALLHYKRVHDDLTGIYHFSGNEAFTKYGMARIMAEDLQVPPECISPVYTQSESASRPMNSHLDTGKLSSLIDLPHTPFKEGIAGVIGSFTW